MDLNETLAFAQVVRSGSFVGAARELGIPKSTLSRRIAELEQRLGARLLQRTTRKQSLTDVGQVYFRHAERVLSEMEAAELAVTRMQEVPRGLLRVSTPINVPYLGPVFASFLYQFPEVQLEVVCTDRRVDLIAEGFDVAVRAGRLVDSTLVAKNLGLLRNFVVASPRFLAARGRPNRPEDLSSFECVLFGAAPDPATWTLTRGNELESVRVHGRLVVNDFDLVENGAREGIGIATLPVHRCADALERGALERVLPEWCSPQVPLHAVYPSARLLSPKVRVFVDHLAKQLALGPFTGDGPERPPTPERREG